MRVVEDQPCSTSKREVWLVGVKWKDLERVYRSLQRYWEEQKKLQRWFKEIFPCSAVLLGVHPWLRHPRSFSLHTKQHLSH